MAHEDSPEPFHARLELAPQRRLEVIDVRRLVEDLYGEEFTRYPRALYASYHTTAGFVEQNLAARLGHDAEGVEHYLRVFRNLFPPDAGYRHDEMELRSELTDDQKQVEPRNADSHLTFMGAGLRNCATYEQGEEPVWFVELDGVYESTRRRRRTSVIAYHREETVARVQMEIPVPDHALDAVSLHDPSLGFWDQLEALPRRFGVAKGRLDVSLASQDVHAGLTVNEYETLLMKHDLRDVLANPFRFVAEKGRNALRDPRAVPAKAFNYAQFDAFLVFNQLMDRLGVRQSVVERIVNRALALPLSRFLRMKRSISLPVLDLDEPGVGQIAQGTYQSPILVQWRKARGDRRVVNVELVRFV